MQARPRRPRAAGALLALALLAPAAQASPAAACTADDDASRVRAAFEDRRRGRGSVFGLLADDAVRTVAGSARSRARIAAARR